MHATRSDGRRRGAIAVMAAAMMVLVLGVLALSFDTMVIAVARGQLQAAADSASLAGAWRLATDRRISPGATDLTAERTAAHDAAVSFAGQNQVLGEAPVVVENSANISDGDVVVGYLDPTSSTATLVTSSASQTQFNSVQATLARSQARGGLIPASFARVLGIESYGARATATATALLYDVGGFELDNGQGPHLLPIVLSESDYENMISPTYGTTDEYTYDETTKTVSNGADGVEESQLYPVKNGNPGNWGTIKIGVSNNSTSTLGAQIRNGITDGQMKQYPGGQIQLSPSTSPPSITFQGNPGISSGIKDDLASIIGKPVMIPIYDQTGGNGNNAWYRVVQFAPVRILSVNFKGNPKYVIVQPALVREHTAIPTGEGNRPWSEGGLVRLHLTR